MLLTHTHPAQLGLRRRTIDRPVHVGPVSLRFITLVLLAAVILFYLIQAAQGANARYRVHELLSEQERLREEQQRLELESLRLRSLSEIRKHVPDLEPAEQINHLPETDSLSAR